PTERHHIPEYFNKVNPMKTEDTYKIARNYMIDTYRLNPIEYLTPTAARRNLCGDVCGLLRIHAFLERWGLINYQCEASWEDSNTGSGPGNLANNSQNTGSSSINLATPSSSHFKVVDTLRSSGMKTRERKKEEDGQQQLFDVTTLSDVGSDGEDDEEEESRKGDFVRAGFIPGTLYKKVDEEEMKRRVKELGGMEEDDNVSEHSTGSNKDAVVPQVDQELLKFSSNLQPANHLEKHSSLIAKMNLELSTDQYGRLGVGVVPSLESSATQSSASQVIRDWSDQEVLLLLEGLEAHGQDWEQIAKHVGDRSVSECVAKFLQLPLDCTEEDDADASGDAVIKESVTEDLFKTVEQFLSVMPKQVVSAASNAAMAEFAALKGVQQDELRAKMDGVGDEDYAQACLLQCTGATYLALAAMKASLLVETDEKRLQDETAELLQSMLRKMRVKEAHLDALLNIQEKQHEALQKDRAQIAFERKVYQNDVARAMESRNRQNSLQANTARPQANRTEILRPK
ncbi:unnamed protein product, partial [Notodromas monacha]